MAYKGNYRTGIRSQEEVDDEPSYIPSRKIERFNRPNNYGSGSPQMRHWKSYLAPELSQQNNQQYSNEEESHTSHISGGRYQRGQQLEGVRSYGYLQQSNRLDRSDDQRYRNPKRGDDYSRRKDEIMNRIKALQDKTSNRQRIEERSESQTNIRRGNFNDQQIQSRLSALQERVQQLESQFESRIERAIQNIQSRLNLK